jgi:hypothetical protein
MPSWRVEVASVTKKVPEEQRRRQDKLSLHPLSIEDALRGAMATGKPPEQPKRERPAGKQGQRSASRGPKKPPA